MEAIIAAIIGVSCAALGYLFREYKNRAVPFIKVYDIQGGSTKTTDYVKIPEHIHKELENTFYIKNILPKSSLGDINNAVKKSNTVKLYWPDLKKEIETLLAISKEGEIMDKVSLLFNSDELKYWILVLLITDKVSIDNANEALPEKTKVFPSDDNEGELWFAFPGKTINFGRNLNNHAIKGKAQPFVDIIAKWDIEAIKAFFNKIQPLLDKEYQAAVTVIHELTELLEEESRWIFYVYFANLSKTPIILKNNNSIEIKDSKKARFVEDFYMSKIMNHEGNDYIKDTEYPLVIPPQSNVQFCLITKKVQREMEYGKALREAFDKNNSKYRLILNIEKIGLFRRQRIKNRFDNFERINK